MKKDTRETYVAVPAIVPARFAFGILRLFKWLLILTCLAVVGFVLFQIALVLNDVSHYRTPPALQHHPHSKRS